MRWGMGFEQPPPGAGSYWWGRITIPLGKTYGPAAGRTHGVGTTAGALPGEGAPCYQLAFQRGSEWLWPGGFGESNVPTAERPLNRGTVSLLVVPGLLRDQSC